MTNLSVYLAESAIRYPDATALVFDDTSASYSALANDVARLADYLIDSGLRPGDRVGVMLPNGRAFAVVFYGVMHAGGVVVPLSPALHARAVEFYLTISAARMLFLAARHAVTGTAAAVTAGAQPVEVGSHGIAHLTAGFPGRAEPVSRDACDAAVVAPIAGTLDAHTIELTHGELARGQAVIAELLLSLSQNDVVMAGLPMTERLGMTCGLLAPISAGSTLVVPGFDPVLDPATALEMIATERITVFEGDPATFVALLDAAHHYDDDFSSLRVAVSAGASLPEDISRRFQDRFDCLVVNANETSVSSPPTNLG